MNKYLVNKKTMETLVITGENKTHIEIMNSDGKHFTVKKTQIERFFTTL